jgi:methionyl-tRNA formyltransferase
MRIVYLGSGAFGLPTLQRLCAEHEVALVVTQPDRPAGRHRHLTPTPVGRWAAEQANLPLVKTDNANGQDVLEQVVAADADAMVIVAFGQFLKQKLVSIPRLGAMNLHASLLPRWRGAAPDSAHDPRRRQRGRQHGDPHRAEDGRRPDARPAGRAHRSDGDGGRVA